MITYKLPKQGIAPSFFVFKINNNIITCVPFDNNTDEYNLYKVWLLQGNVPGNFE